MEVMVGGRGGIRFMESAHREFVCEMKLNVIFKDRFIANERAEKKVL